MSLPRRACVCLAVGGLGGVGTPVLHAMAPPPDGRIHVTYWEKWTQFEERAIRAVIAEFERSQDRIAIDYLPVGLIDRKTIVATAGGDPPDIAGLWAPQVAAFADAGALESLDPYIEHDGLTPAQWLARYEPVYASICEHNGHVFAGISTPLVMTLHWNRTMFRAAGLDPDRPPRTLAEFNAYCRLLTKRDPRTGEILQMGFLPQEPGWWPGIFLRWFGGELWDAHGVTLAKDPHNLAAMEWVAGFTRDNGGPDAINTFAAGFGGMTSAQNPFYTGKIAMVFQGVWLNNYIRQYKPGLDFGVGPWPEAVPGVKDFAMVESDVLVIPRGAKHAAAAWEFIKFVNSHNPNARTRAELQGGELLCFMQEKNSPMRQWSPFFTEHHPHPYIKEFRTLAASPHAAFLGEVGIFPEYNRELATAFDRVRLLMATPGQALADAQARLDVAWARYRRSLERHGLLPQEMMAPATP
ncbi:ABC transporter substrate-binding protein [Horticoccus luteus]|uniref:ABC transporter substrate-binding protein n=1 Tax=Horticoccus luteus TaxID=2862869 RepID=A0A8F9XLL8_9BACT|nr:ABC transporter substrate-binding protein [Horticoccus luteus]QYM79164.1 ABC transporter substrate-binding protein [Horticoccus luteus]